MKPTRTIWFLYEIAEKLGVRNEVKVFWNGGDALRYLLVSAEIPHVIISDINMSLMDGITFKKTIKACVSSGQKSLSFLSTGTLTLEETLSDLGGLGYYNKGNSSEELTAALRAIISQISNTRIARG